MRNKETRESKGVAFVLFLERSSALEAVKGVDNTEVSCKLSFKFVDTSTAVFIYYN